MPENVLWEQNVQQYIIFDFETMLSANCFPFPFGVRVGGILLNRHFKIETNDRKAKFQETFLFLMQEDNVCCQYTLI